MKKARFEHVKPFVNIGTIGYVDRGATILTAAIAAMLAASDRKAMEESGIQLEYPVGSRVKVTHSSGEFFGSVVGWEDAGNRVRIIRDMDGKSLKWWKGQVELAQNS